MKELATVTLHAQAVRLQQALQSAGIEAAIISEAANSYLGTMQFTVWVADSAATETLELILDALADEDPESENPYTSVSVSDGLARCRSCGYDLRGQVRDGKCPECGYPYVIVHDRRCPHCGADVPRDFDVCWRCNSELPAPSAETPAFGQKPPEHAPLELWLVSPDPAMADAFRQRFSQYLAVQVFQCTFEKLAPHDCFVTAGNSYGIMTAGIDAAVVNFFGRSIMQAVQNHIRTRFLGEQPIGTAFVLPTGHPHIPFLVHAPTMRTPSSIDGTDRIYAATWAALLAVRSHNLYASKSIRTLAFPAFGTGFGQVPFDEAARQMSVAYAHYLAPPERLDWDTVVAREKAICYDGSKHVIRDA
jgi:O-acetyl-ADP-ribose deacetylase (regulator of RNase III)